MVCVSASLLAIFAGSASGAPSEDQVTSLPGWKGALPSRWWSGFLELPNSLKKIHYTFIEKIDDPKAAEAPVVMWTNGGPGCSGYDGLLYEHGPLLISHDGSELVYNEQTWAKHANMLYIEAPVGVGFSYSGNKADYTTGDNQTAADNHAGLVEFFSKFPEYKENELYVSGESYGGVYVPTLSQKIFRDATFPGNMQGFLCGNCVFDSTCGHSTVPFLYGHGALSQDLYDEAVAACGAPYFNRTSDQCREVTRQAEELSDGLNVYDFYRDCYQSEEQKQRLSSVRFNPWQVMTDRHHLRQQRFVPRPPHPAVAKALPPLDPIPCIDSEGATKYLNRDDVKKALHVEESTVPYWSICSDIIDYQDDGVYPELSPLYREMMGKYRIIVYNGDSDPGCNYLQDHWCVRGLGAPTKEKWGSWRYNDSSVTSQGEQVGGWTVSYDVGGELRFITIKGAGHMAPQWRPLATTTMFARFLQGEPFQSSSSKFII